ncbi:MAG: discoidin domain-containing protein [Candidatus Woesearchaeota archaeon]|nr:discoidin domain-containing protein [Candidatus Woesearchaeota archaeon]
MKRGQAAVEFLVLTGFMMLVFTTFFLVVQERTAMRNQQAMQNELVTVAEIVEQEVAIANSVKEGYNRIFELPTFINGKNYTITMHPPEAPSEIVITMDEEEFIFFLQTPLAENSEIKPGFNHIIKEEAGNVTITEASDIECRSDDDCPVPSSCEEFECIGAGVLAYCLRKFLPDTAACDDDILSCTNDFCDGAGTCVHTDNCPVGKYCDMITPGACQQICEEQYGWTNIRYNAGTYGYNWNAQGAITRNNVFQDDALCCDLATECRGNTQCAAVHELHGQYDRWLCAEKGGENTFLRCDDSNDGVAVHSNEDFCCSQYTQGDFAGEYGFTVLGHVDKQEGDSVPGSCDDGSDNDCDGLEDENDPDCGPVCIPLPLSAYAASQTYAGSSPTYAFDGNLGTYWNAGGYPPQWVEGFTPAAVPIQSLSLVVERSPASGDMTFEVYGALHQGDGDNPHGPFTPLTTVSGEYTDGETVTIPAVGLWQYNYYKVQVTSSTPSTWVAFAEIYACI